MSSGNLSQRPGLTKNFFVPGAKKLLTNRRRTTTMAPPRQNVKKNFKKRLTHLGYLHANVCGKFTKIIVDILLARPRQNRHVKQFFWLVLHFSEKMFFSHFLGRRDVPRGTPGLDENVSHLRSIPVMMAICRAIIMIGQIVRITSHAKRVFSSVVMLPCSHECGHRPPLGG